MTVSIVQLSRLERRLDVAVRHAPYAGLAVSALLSWLVMPYWPSPAPLPGTLGLLAGNPDVHACIEMTRSGGLKGQLRQAASVLKELDSGAPAPEARDTLLRMFRTQQSS